jgi:hypothetical protein
MQTRPFSPRLKDAQLAEACLTALGNGGDLVCLGGCSALRNVSCLVGLEQLQELDISRCNGVDATTVAKVIADNQALSKLVVGGSGYDSHFNPAVPATLELGMTEVDFSDKELGPSGAIIIAAWITHKDRGAMTSLNLSGNAICEWSEMDGIKAIASALKVTAVILIPISCPSDQ